MTSYSHPQAHHLRRQVCLWIAGFPPSHPLKLFQNYSQFTRDSGNKENKVIQNTVSNIFSGQVVGETAKILPERFGKVLQKQQSMTINQREKSTLISTQMNSLIPPAKDCRLDKKCAVIFRTFA